MNTQEQARADDQTSPIPSTKSAGEGKTCIETKRPYGLSGLSGCEEELPAWSPGCFCWGCCNVEGCLRTSLATTHSMKEPLYTRPSHVLLDVRADLTLSRGTTRPSEKHLKSGLAGYSSQPDKKTDLATPVHETSSNIWDNSERKRKPRKNMEKPAWCRFFMVNTLLCDRHQKAQ